MAHDSDNDTRIAPTPGETNPFVDASSGPSALDRKENSSQTAYCTVPNVYAYTVLCIDPGQLTDATAGDAYVVGTSHPLADHDNSLAAVAGGAADTRESEWAESDDPNFPPMDPSETLPPERSAA